MISEFVVALAVLFIPGLIWAKIELKYGTMVNRSYRELMINAFLFNGVIYTILFVIYYILNKNIDILQIAKITKQGRYDKLLDEFLWAFLISLVFAYCWLIMNQKRLMLKFLRLAKVSERNRDQDVWTMMHSSKDRKFEFVRILDWNINQFIEGYVIVNSESEETRELLLQEANIFDFKGNLVYSSPLLYIARNKDDLTLDFPLKEDQND